MAKNPQGKKRDDSKLDAENCVATLCLVKGCIPVGFGPEQRACWDKTLTALDAAIKHLKEFIHLREEM